MLQTVIKVHLSYRCLVYNFSSPLLFYLVNIYNGIESYNVGIISIRLNILSSFMVLVVLLISSRALINAIDYLSIIESYLFLCYISSLQLSMVPFSFSNDLIITFPNRDSGRAPQDFIQLILLLFGFVLVPQHPSLSFRSPEDKQ